MRILVLSWEYPPRIVGGLGRHVAALTRSLAAAGHEVTVVSRGHPDAPDDEVVAGVRIVRVGDAPPALDFDDHLVEWVLAFNDRLLATAAALCRRQAFDVVHAHDWLVAYAAAACKDAFGLPLTATIHATEFGRHQGWLPGPRNKYIHQVEWWLTWEARRVITCSSYMRRQVLDIFRLPPAKVDVVPNGVDMDDFRVDDHDVAALRRELAPDGQHLLAFAGRLEYEKGVQTMLAGMHALAARVGPVRLAVAGVGSYAQQLRDEVDELGLHDGVAFTGFLDRSRLRALYAAADVVVAPSLYEPFGLVALEAMAAGTPAVVADTGGLRELARIGTGVGFPPEDVDALVAAVAGLVEEPDEAAALVAAGREVVATRHDWDRIAARTVEVHGLAITQEAGMQAVHPPLREVLRTAPILELGELAG